MSAPILHEGYVLDVTDDDVVVGPHGAEGNSVFISLSPKCDAPDMPRWHLCLNDDGDTLALRAYKRGVDEPVFRQTIAVSASKLVPD